MFGGGCTARILLDPNPKQHYVTGDIISGTIDLHTSGMYSVTDVQVKLRCDEYSVATYYVESDRRRARREYNAQSRGLIRPLRQAAQQQALKQIGKAGNFDEDTMQIVGDGLKMVRERKKHYQLATNAFSTAAGEDKTMLSQGHHTYPFSFRLSESINKCPPHAPVSTSHGLKIGVFWTLKVVVRRPGRFQADIREVIRVPIYPENIHRDHIDLSTQKRISETGQGTAGSLTAYLTYPRAGIPQDGRSIPIGIEVVADGKYDVHTIKLTFEQTCISKAKGFKETHMNIIDLGSARGPQLVNESADLIPYFTSLQLENLIPPTLSLSNVKISYELVLSIAAMDKPIIFRTPITVLSPADTEPPRFSSQQKSPPGLPPKYSHASSLGSSSTLPSLPSRRESSYTHPDKSSYSAGSQRENRSDSSSQASSTNSDDAPTHTPQKMSSNSSTRLETRPESNGHDRKPPLPDRTPLDAPPYPERPRYTSSVENTVSDVTHTDESNSGSYMANLTPSSAPPPLPVNRASIEEAEPWYPGMLNISHGPNLHPNHVPPPSMNEVNVPTSFSLQMESNPTGSTDSTLVEPVDSLEGLHIPPEQNENEQSSDASAGLPSYDDAVRTRNFPNP